MINKLSAAFVLVAAVTLGLSGGRAAVQAGGGCHQITKGFTDAAATTVAIEQCKFVPAVVRAEAGDAIQWQNNDPITHMVTGVAGSWGDSKPYEQGQSVSYTFSEPGVYPYFCELHPGMVGAIVVGDGAAASADTGAGVLAVSDRAPAAGGAQPASSPQGDDGGDDFGLAAIAIVALAAATIGGALLLGGLRLSGRLPRARERVS